MEEITGNWKKNFDYKFISAEDLEGQNRTLTIKSVGKDTAFNAKANKNEDVLVITFAETDKMMVLNRTNAKTITRNTGTPVVEKWKGVKITLTPKLITVGREDVLAIRVKDEQNFKANQK